jgi:hypothetical protein
LGCRHGYANLGNLALDLDETLSYYTSLPNDWIDDRAPRILELLATELSLRPWHDVRTRFHDLQSRLMSSLKTASTTDPQGG